MPIESILNRTLTDSRYTTHSETEVLSCSTAAVKWSLNTYSYHESSGGGCTFSIKRELHVEWTMLRWTA